jgi:hypothetical protein
MPTKPSTVFSFATQLNYTTGSRIGSPTKVAPVGVEGWVPGTNAAPEQGNYCLHWTGNWLTNWVDLGTSAADLDAHIVETDSNGVTNLAYANIGGTAGATQVALTVDANTGATSSAMTVTNNSGGFGLTSSTNGASASIRGTCTGSGAGVEGRATGGSGPGVLGAGGTTGNGVEGTGGTTSGVGVEGTSITSGNAGVQGLSSSTAGHTGFGVRGLASNLTGGGVSGVQTWAGASPTIGTQCAIYGLATDASAVYAESDNGHGLVAETTANALAPIHMVPHPGKPTSVGTGDIWYDSTPNRLKTFQASTVAGVILHGSEYGWAGGTTNSVSGTQNVLGESSALVTLSLAADEMPTTASRFVNLTVTGCFRNQDATLHHVTIRVRDTTGGSPGSIVAQQTIYLAETYNAVTNTGVFADAYERLFTLRERYTVPAAGARSFTVTIQQSTTSGAGIAWDKLMLSLDGVY